MADRAMVDNAASTKQIREGKRQERLAAEIELDDWKALLALPAGRRRLWWLIETCGVFRNAFHKELGPMAFATGEQNIGLQVIAKIEAATPAALTDMMRDAALQRNAPNG